MKLQAYNPEWAFRTALLRLASRWKRQELLSATQLSAIEAAHPFDYYRPAWALRVGLFLFTWFGIAMAGGFFSLVTGNSTFASGVLCCAGCFGALEWLIQECRFYRCGIDNALLYCGLAVAAGLIFYFFFTFARPFSFGEYYSLSNAHLALPLLLVLAVLLAATVRYGDAVVAGAAFLTALLVLALLAMQSALGQALLPFLMMGGAAAALALSARLTKRLAETNLADYYASCLKWLKVLALVVFYLGGNYLVVREGNAALHDASVSAQVPFAPLFYAFTAGIPLLYIVLGLRRADRPMLLVGLLALAFSFYTLRHYRSLMPPEVAAVAAGLLLTVAAGALLRALRPARFGLTSLPDDEPRHFNLENLIQAQTAHVAAAPTAGGFAFGGGQSGGGGATGQF